MREDLASQKKKAAAAAKRKAAPAKKVTSPKVRAQTKTKANQK
jgi:hypothetical protein